MLPTWYNNYKDFIEENIENYLNDYFKNNINNSEALKDFEEVIRYSVQGGKKIRAILALEFYLLLSNKKFSEIDCNSDIIKVCLAIEFNHSWTLLQDDLPCMDNDILRRGNPTVWSKFGEYKAVLASDVLQSISYELLCEIDDNKLSGELMKILSKTMGFYGVIGGQAEDIFYENNPKKLNENILLGIHRKKTAKLIKAAVMMGIITSGKNNDLNLFSEYGEKLGLAFQIKDDILDVEGNIEDMGKSVGRGEEKGFVFFQGLERSKEKLGDLLLGCHEISTTLGSEKLQFITDYVGNRVK